MREFLTIAYAVAWRNIHAAVANPAFLVPPIVAPLIFFATFVGAFSAITGAPGFDFPGGYTSFQFVFVLIQAAAFNGVFLGFYIARDFESGFHHRLMLAASDRRALIAGYAMAAVTRATASFAVLFGVGFAVGMQVDGNVLELLGLVGLGEAVAIVASLWGSGLAMRLRTVQAAPMMQMPVFLGLFLSPVFVPLALLTGWIEGVASYNPFTVFLEAGRGYISGTEADTALAFGVAAGLFVLLTVWSIRGLRSAERAG